MQTVRRFQQLSLFRFHSRFYIWVIIPDVRELLTLVTERDAVCFFLRTRGQGLGVLGYLPHLEEIQVIIC